MITLAIESSTAMGSVALLDGDLLLGEEQSLIQRSHSEFLNSAISRILIQNNLSLSHVDWIACSPGPGSFTGVRVASSLAKTLAYSLDKKIWSVDSLEILAAFDPQIDQPQKLVAINAFKNMVYYSLYLGTKKILGPQVIELSLLEDSIGLIFPSGSIHFCGDTFDLLPSFLSEVMTSRLIPPSHSALIHPTASVLGSLSHQRPEVGQTLDWISFQPLYLRASEAEENLRLRANLATRR